jgi:hypothetical protein
MILMRYHKTNDISQNFSGITLGFCEVSKYFVEFRFCFQYFPKMTAKFRFPSNIFEISKFRTFQWRKLKKSISQLPSVWGPSLNLKFRANVTDNDKFASLQRCAINYGHKNVL